MKDTKALHNAFKEWTYSVYKRSAAIRLCQTLDCVECFLQETAILKTGFWNLKADEMARYLDNLNRNRVFKFRNREAMPYLGKLSNALSAFSASSAYTSAAKQSEDISAESPADNETLPLCTSDQEVRAIDHPIIASALSAAPDDASTVQSDFDSNEIQEELPAEKAVRNILEKCLIKLNGETISREAISQCFLSFLSEVSGEYDHNIGIVLHTGSIIFDALAVLWGAIASMLANETSPEDLVRSLQTGDLVEYEKNGRFRFEGIFEKDGIPQARLVQDDRYKSTITSPITAWSKITPYQGKAIKIDGRGSRSLKTKRKKFYTEVLNIKEYDIPSVTDVSTVFIMSREKADMLVKGLSICHNDDVFELLDLVTASWYTENGEHPYSGNPGKNEPVLKFAGSISVGRAQLLKRDGNRHAGLFVCGNDEICKSESELPELLNRKKLQYVHLLMGIDMEQGEKLVADNPSAEVFSCTKDFLLSCPLQLQEENAYTLAFSEQVDAILDHSVSCITASGFIDWKTLQSFRRALFDMMSSDYETQTKDDFISSAWSLISLFQTMPFEMSLLEGMIQDGKIASESPSARILRMAEQAAAFPEEIAVSAKHIIAVLESCYQSMIAQENASVPNTADSAFGKFSAITKLIRERADKRICVVVPKQFYANAMLEAGFAHLVSKPENLTIMTANRFDRSRIFDCIIAVGDFKGKRFDCFRCTAAKEVISVLYPCERNQYLSKKRQALRTDKLYNERSFIRVDMDDSAIADYEGNATEAEVQQLEQITAELDSFTERLTKEVSSVPKYARGDGSGKGEAEIAAAASFVTGKRAFFTPYYNAYVFDEVKKEIVERSIAKDGLRKGDLVVFTRNDNGMHDIVDDVMDMLIQNERLKEEEQLAYKKSKIWKRKLLYYMRLSKKNAADIAEEMKRNGISITPQTIRIWVDSDSHIVGPQETMCIQQIGLLVGDSDMAKHPENTISACRIVRQRRRNILKVIGQLILDKLCGRTSTLDDPLAQEIYSRIDSQADIMEVESFMPMKETMLAAYANKPINVKEEKNDR